MRCKPSVLLAVVFCLPFLWTSTLDAAVKVTILGGAPAPAEWTDKLRARIDDPEVELATPPAKIPEGTSSQMARQVGSDLLVILDPPNATTAVPGFGIWDKSGTLLAEGTVGDDLTVDLGTAIRFAKAKFAGIGKGTVRLSMLVGSESGELGLAEPLRLGLEKLLVQNPKIAIIENAAKIPADRAKEKEDFVVVISENDVSAAEMVVKCQLLDREHRPLLDLKYQAPQFNGKFFANLANELATALKKEPSATEAVVARASRRLQQTGDRFYARKETSSAILHWFSGALLNIHDFDLTGNLIRQLAVYSSSIQFGPRPDLYQFTVGTMQFRLHAIRQLPAKKAALLAFEVGSKGDDRRFYTLSRLNSAVQDAVRSSQTEFGEPWPADVTKLITKLHTEATTELFARWQKVVADDPRSFADFTKHLNESHRMMMHYANGQNYRVAEVDAIVVEMVLSWLKVFESLPKEDQRWDLITLGLLHVSTNTPGAVGEQLEPLWHKLEHHDHPLVRLHALRGRTQHDWDNPKISADERVRRYKQMMDAIIVAAKAEKAADRSGNLHILKEVISTFNNNIKYPETPEISVVQLEYAEKFLKDGFVHHVALTQMTNPIDEATAKKSLELLRSHPDQSNSVARRIQELERKYPALRDLQAIAALPKVRQLVDMAGFGRPGAGDLLQYIHVRGDSVYGMWIKNPNRNPSAAVLKINLKSGVMTSSEGIAIPWDGAFRGLLNEQLTVGFAGEANYFFGGLKIGIYQCGLDENAVPKSIITAAELDSKPMALQVVDDRLYVGTADGALWQYHLESREKELLISGKRKVSQTKLDGVGAFEIAAVMPDPPRRRILLLVHSKTPELKALTNGVWSLPLGKTGADPKSLEKLLELKTPTGNSSYAVSGGLSNDDLLLTSWGLLHWNLKSDKKVLLSTSSWGTIRPTADEFLPMVRSPILCQNSLWWSGFYGLSEMKPDAKRAVTHNLDLGDKRPNDSGDTSYLAPLDENRFLMYSGQRLYEITPNK